MTQWLRLVAAGIIAVTCAGVAQAQSTRVCGDHASLRGRLMTTYAEQLAYIALTEGGAVLEIYTSENGLTWTAMVVYVDGTACVVASGQAWLKLNSARKGRDS